MGSRKRRRITVRGEVFTYTIGTGSVRITWPDGSSRAVLLTVVTGRSEDVLERGQWKKTSDGMVTPKDIAAYIERSGPWMPSR